MCLALGSWGKGAQGGMTLPLWSLESSREASWVSGRSWREVQMLQRPMVILTCYSRYCSLAVSVPPGEERKFSGPTETVPHGVKKPILKPCPIGLTETGDKQKFLSLSYRTAGKGTDC